MVPQPAREVAEVFRQGYRTTGYEPPWTGYVAREDGAVVGICGFKTAPRDGKVEIAYFTLPDRTRRGVATRMAEALIQLARKHQPGVVVTAQTLPETGPSTAILLRLGFEHVADVRHPEDGLVWEWHLASPRLA